MTSTSSRFRRGERARALAAACVLALLAACSRDPGTGAVGAGIDPDRGLPPPGICEDDRVDYLLASPVRTEPFLADTADMIPVLVSKLGFGQQDPMIAAKTELARLGAAALPELARFIEAQMNDANGGGRLTNAFGALTLMADPGAHALLARGLDHPQESVRIAAMRGLVKHPASADYDRILAQVSLSNVETQRVIAEALAAADPARAQNDLLDWMEARRFQPACEVLLPRLCEARRPELLPRIHALLANAPPEPAAWLRAAVAANGDLEALAALRTTLRDGTGPERTLAVQALHRAGLGAECAVVLESDPEASRRALAAQNLSACTHEPAVRTALQRGLADPVREVRKLCLGTLVQTGDANAIDTAVQMLGGDRVDLEDAVLALREAWQRDAALAQRSFDRLAALRRGEAGPARVEVRALDRAISLLPLDAAAELLYAAALEPGAPISGVTRHRWYAQMIGNAGAPGARFLQERWKTEPDPVRRLDLFASAIYAQDDAARDLLVAVLDDPRTTPCEGLYAADKLCHFGPAERMAPILKRYALRIADPRTRPALNDLLWRWYGLQG